MKNIRIRVIGEPDNQYYAAFRHTPTNSYHSFAFSGPYTAKYPEAGLTPSRHKLYHVARGLWVLNLITEDQLLWPDGAYEVSFYDKDQALLDMTTITTANGNDNGASLLNFQDFDPGPPPNQIFINAFGLVRIDSSIGINLNHITPNVITIASSSSAQIDSLLNINKVRPINSASQIQISNILEIQARQNIATNPYARLDSNVGVGARRGIQVYSVADLDSVFKTDAVLPTGNPIYISVNSRSDIDSAIQIVLNSVVITPKSINFGSVADLDANWNITLNSILPPTTGMGNVRPIFLRNNSRLLRGNLSSSR